MATVVQYPARLGRNSELALIILALAIGASAFLLTAVGTGATDYTFCWVQIGTLVVLGLVSHVLLRFLAPWADPVMLPLVLTLNALGLAMIARIDFYYRATGATHFVVGYKQLLMTVVGCVLFWLTIWAISDHRRLRTLTYISMLAAIVFLVMPMLPGLGQEINGARIWIRLFGFSFQPAELAKICLAVFFAGYLEYRRDSLAIAGKKIGPLQLPRGRDLGPILVVWLASLAVLVFQRDLGTALLLFGLFVAMLYVATDRVSWIVTGAILFIPSALVAIRFFPHVASRFTVWLHALDQQVFEREYGGSGQLVRGLFGLASGGLTGTGWGRGYPGIVPFANSDFIIASLGEELGFTGLAAILLMFLILVERGMRAALGVRDGFGKLLASGLSFVIALQVFVVVGGVSRLIPLTGLTTPFMAYGGSSLVANWIILGLLLRISHSARRPAEAPWTGSGSTVPAPPAGQMPGGMPSSDAKLIEANSVEDGWDEQGNLPTQIVQRGEVQG